MPDFTFNGKIRHGCFNHVRFYPHRGRAVVSASGIIAAILKILPTGGGRRSTRRLLKYNQAHLRIAFDNIIIASVDFTRRRGRTTSLYSTIIFQTRHDNKAQFYTTGANHRSSCFLHNQGEGTAFTKYDRIHHGDDFTNRRGGRCCFVCRNAILKSILNSSCNALLKFKIFFCFKHLRHACNPGKIYYIISDDGKIFRHGNQ